MSNLNLWYIGYYEHGIMNILANFNKKIDDLWILVSKEVQKAIPDGVTDVLPYYILNLYRFLIHFRMKSFDSFILVPDLRDFRINTIFSLCLTVKLFVSF